MWICASWPPSSATAASCVLPGGTGGPGERDGPRPVVGLFLRALQRFTPGITLADLAWGPSGIRAQALRRNGALVEDFAIARGPHVLHVQNAPSPAATASLAIGREPAATAVGQFEL